MSRKETVKKFVVESFLFGDASRLKDEASLLENGIVDSTGMLEMINFLEATYAIKIQDQELLPSNLDSVVNIDNFLTSKLGRE